jgi:hypothetical protein
MNKKITSSALAALMIAGTTSFSAFAAMANGTVVIGTKAYDLAYANDPNNIEEITNAIVSGGEVYVKDFEGNWINNTTGLKVEASVIPAVIYKNVTGVVTNFDAQDKDGTAPTLKVTDIKFSDYKTMIITLGEKVSGTPVVKVNGVVEKAENVALSADGMSINVARSSEFAVGTYSVVVNGLKHVATNADMPDATISVVKDASYPAAFTNITNAITNLSKDVYLTAVDQYAKAYNISVDSSYKLTVTVNGMPLTASEASLTAVNNMAKVTLTKALVENNVVVIKVEKFDKDATDVTAKSLSTLSSTFTVGKDAAAVATSILGVNASANTILAGDAAVTLTADVRDQFNNPASSQLRWIVIEGGNLLDTSGDLNSNTLTVDKNGNTATFKAVKPGTITINSYNMLNGAKATYTVQVGAAKLTEVTLTSENPATEYNDEIIKYNKIVQNAGTILTPDMVKFNVVAKTKDTVASDITVTATLRGGIAADKNDIVISAKTTKVGTYEITPFIGTTFDAEGTIKAAKFDVVTTLNPVATKIDSISLPMIKVGTAQKANLVVRNAHNEAIDVVATNVEAIIYKNGQNSNEIQVEELDKDGQVAIGNTVVKALRFNATVAGNYTVRVNIAGTVATYDITVSSEVTSLKSIELGNNIIDNSVIANATDDVYRVLSVKDNKDDEITPDTSNWVISTKNGSNVDVANFASVVYYKHDAKGVIVTASQADAEGIALKFLPSADLVKAYDVDTTLAITVGNKGLAAADVIKDTLNVTVKAKSAVKAITLADVNVSLIPGATVKKEIVVLDQYGKAITDTSMVQVVGLAGAKATAVLSYDGVAKKMYITYTGVTTGTDTIVVKSVADATIKVVANITIGDNTNISTIAFDANNYKVYNSTTDADDQTVILTYKVNGGSLDIPASAIIVTSDPNVTVVKNGGTLEVKAKAGVNSAAVGIGDKDAVITISILTANGKSSSIDLTFSDDESVVNKSTVGIKDTVDENNDVAGVQLVIGKDKDGNVVVETTGQITLIGKDQYGTEKEVQADTTWASANDAVATVDSTGLVTKVAPGKTTVTGFYKGNLYTIEVEVPVAN